MVEFPWVNGNEWGLMWIYGGGNSGLLQSTTWCVSRRDGNGLLGVAGMIIDIIDGYGVDHSLMPN